MGWDIEPGSKEELIKGFPGGPCFDKEVVNHDDDSTTVWAIVENGDSKLIVCLLIESALAPHFGWSDDPSVKEEFKGKWATRAVAETEGPSDLSCPLRFFDKVPLTDPSNQWAQQWREKVIRFNELDRLRKGERRSFPISDKEKIQELLPDLLKKDKDNEELVIVNCNDQILARYFTWEDWGNEIDRMSELVARIGCLSRMDNSYGFYLSLLPVLAEYAVDCDVSDEDVHKEIQHVLDHQRGVFCGKCCPRCNPSGESGSAVVKKPRPQHLKLVEESPTTQTEKTSG